MDFSAKRMKRNDSVTTCVLVRYRMFCCVCRALLVAAWEFCLSSNVINKKTYRLSPKDESCDTKLLLQAELLFGVLNLWRKKRIEHMSAQSKTIRNVMFGNQKFVAFLFDSSTFGLFLAMTSSILAWNHALLRLDSDGLWRRMFLALLTALVFTSG